MTTPDETVLVMSCSPDFAARQHLECIAISICETARCTGARAFAQWVGPRLKLRLRGYGDEQVSEALNGFTNWAQRRQYAMHFVRTRVPTTPLPDLQVGMLPWGTVTRATLTRALLERLPEGCFVISSILNPDCTPLLRERVGSPAARALLWERAKLLRVTQRRCWLAWDAADAGLHAAVMR